VVVIGMMMQISHCMCSSFASPFWAAKFIS
jgi:hypothetical protein